VKGHTSTVEKRGKEVERDKERKIKQQQNVKQKDKEGKMREKPNHIKSSSSPARR